MNQKTMNRDTVISLQGVSKSYVRGAPPALVPTDLEVGEGEFFSLLGPSGCGKTTILRIIAGFEETTQGIVQLDGINVTNTPPYRRNINTVFQNYALFPNMTARENVTFPLKMAGETGSDAMKRVDQALDMVSMVEFSNRLPHLMSGGQRQRVALARAIIGRPRVLLLDEPLGALDLKLRQQMQHVLVNLQRDLGITFVYVTHDQSEALSMSDRLAVMNEGRIQQIGAPQDVYYRPENAFVADFIGGSNILTVDIASQDGGASYDIGSMKVPAPLGAATGSHKIAIRHEAVMVAKDRSAALGDFSTPATVRDVLFLGQSVEYKLQAGTVELTSAMPSVPGQFLSRGDKVHAMFNTSDIVVLSD